MPPIAASRVFQPISASEGVKFELQGEVFQCRDVFLEYGSKFDYLIVGTHRNCIKRRRRRFIMSVFLGV